MQPRLASWWVCLVLGSLALGGCQPAHRYPFSLGPARKESQALPVPAPFAWLEPAQTSDLPLVFVPSTSPEWPYLGFWTSFPVPAAGASTIHLGLPPLAAAVAMAAAEQMEAIKTRAIKIKVPLGLPDPTPNIPAANPPTLGKWQLGQQLFFAKILSPEAVDKLACASCHRPQHGFADDWPIRPGDAKHAPSLINCVFNQTQFWDGRVRHLEEVLVRRLEDEQYPTENQSPQGNLQGQHVWGGLVAHLAAQPKYRQRFQEVFGIEQPTQDTIAKALATYLRTLLSGHSPYDRAQAQRRQEGAAELTAKHFEAVLGPDLLKTFGSDQAGKSSLAGALGKGHRLFQGQAGCQACHRGPLFTDHDFHNIGIGDSLKVAVPGREHGRFAHVPVGLKQARLVGAYKTPSLRALPRTPPYMHDGSLGDLEKVVAYYNNHNHQEFNTWLNPYLAGPLRKSPNEARRLHLTAEEMRALVLFLRSLDGDPLEPILVKKE